MKKRVTVLFFLIAYSVFLIKVMVFKDLPLIRIGSLMLNFGGTHVGPANLVPFRTILPYLLGEKGLIIAGINIAGNIVLLVPIGFLVPFVFLNMGWKKIIALAVCTGFTIEALQVLLQVGIFDIDDVILNATGVMVGYWVYTIFARRLPRTKARNFIIATMVFITVAAAAVLYSFIFYQQEQVLVNSGTGAGNGLPDSLAEGDNSIHPGSDPCNGTGGTGQIVSMGDNNITIKRRDGTLLIISFTDHTTIRTATGAASKSDLKTGDRVTVVVDLNNNNSGTATMVVVCQEAGQQRVK